MPEDKEKAVQKEQMVDIDTSGPETEVNLPEEPVQETAPAEQETVKEVKEEKKVTKKHILREMYEKIGGK